MEDEKYDAETNKQAIDFLEKAYSKIKDRKNWVQGVMARDNNGYPVHVNDNSACKFCMLGACYSLVKYDFHKVLLSASNKYVLKAIHELVESSIILYKEISLANLNDYVGHEAVCNVFERAIKELSKSATNQSD